MIPKDVRDNFDKIYRERLDGYAKDAKQSRNLPPWAKRKAQGIARSLAHPDIYRVLCILQICTPDSVFAIRSQLINYLYDDFGLPDEIAETWILYFSIRDPNVLDARRQIDSIRYFNDDAQIAGPADVDEQLSYRDLVLDKARKDPHMNIRLGRSVTKQDAKWFIDHYWDSHIEPKLRPYKQPGQRNREMLRNSTIYALSKQSMNAKDIQAYIIEHYGNEATPDLPTIYNVIQSFTPQADWFEGIEAQLKAPANATKQELLKPRFKIEFIEQPKPHFTLSPIKDN